MYLHVAAVQMRCTNFAVQENLDNAEIAIQKAVHHGAQLVLLPEFFHIGYCYDDQLHSVVEAVGGRTTQWLLKWSRKTGALIGGCIAEEDGCRLYDTFLLATPSGKLHRYRKRHPAFFENLYFARGKDVGIFNTEIGRVGVMICWDMVQPRLAKGMVDLIDWLIISAAWPDMSTGNWPLPFVQSWVTQQSRTRPRLLATQLQVPTLFSNMTGTFQTRVPGLGIQYRSRFAGHSALMDGHGNVIASSTFEETIVHGFIGPGHRALPAAA